MSDSVQHDQFPYCSFFYQKFNQERGEILRKKILIIIKGGCLRGVDGNLFIWSMPPQTPPITLPTILHENEKKCAQIIGTS